MYKLLIVDDEYIVIESITRIVNKYLPDIKIVGSAENGRRAIEIAEELNPDIIFMDIEMSGINGFEAIKEIKKNLQCQFVIISAYDYFSYAKEAITQGVVEYILKPFDKDQIIEVIGKVVENIENEKSKRKNELIVREKLNNTMSLLEDEIVNRLVFFNESSEEELKRYLKLFDISFDAGSCFILSVQGGLPQNPAGRIHGMIKNSLKCVTGFITDKNLLVFLPADSEAQDRTAGNHTVDALKRLYESIIKNYKVEVLMAVGSTYKGNKGINTSFKEALDIVRNSGRTGGIIFYENLARPAVASTDCISPHILKINERERFLLSKLKLGDKEESLKAFDKLYQEIESSSRMDYNEIKNRLLELVVSLFKVAAEENIKGDGRCLNYNGYIDEYLSIGNINNLISWIKETIEYICDCKINDSGRSLSIAELAKDYIRENYKNEISLEDVAKKIHISSSYLSKLFKDVIGENFIDYITRIRIDKSIELLKSTNLSIKEISYELGYIDPNYFCKVFKRVTGYTPSETRKCVNSDEREGEK